MTSAANGDSVQDVILRVGSTLSLRPARPADVGALVEFFRALRPCSGCPRC